MPEILGTSKSIYGFDPRSIGGCVAWLDGADSNVLYSDASGTTLATVSGAVRRWNDKSGQGNYFSNRSANTSTYYPTRVSGGGVSIPNSGSPTYNAGTYVCLQSVSNFMAFPYYTIYTVVNSTTTSGLPTLFTSVRNASNVESRSPNFGIGGSFSLGNPTYSYANSRFSFGDYNGVSGTGANTGEAAPSGVTTVMGLTSGILSNSVSVAGAVTGSYGNEDYTPWTTCGAPPTIGGAFYLFNAGTADNRWLNGTIYETLVFNSELTRKQCEEIEGYLSWKWGRQTALPTSHPFQLIAPLARGFTPIDIPGCQLWLDGGDATSVTGTSTVTEWRDKSGNGRNLGVGSGTTSYASNGVTLTNSYMFVDSAVDLTSFTVFIVVKSNAATNNQVVFIGRPDSQYDYLSSDGFAFYMDYQSSIRFYGYNSGTQLINVSTTTTDAQVFSFTSGSTLISGQINGASITGASGLAARTYTAQGFAIGASWNGLGYDTINATATIYEIIVYNTSLTNVQRQAVEGYLAWKWGLNSSLSSSNPMYKLPPSSVQQFKPTDINVCSLWLDSADPVATGGGSTLTNWTDKSGLGNTATSGSGTITITSNGLTFDGSSKYMTITGLAGDLANTSFVIFFVETYTGSNNGYYFGDDNVNSGGATDSSLHIGYRSRGNHTFAFYNDDLENYAVSGSGFRRIMTNWLPESYANRVTRRNGAEDVRHGNAQQLTDFTAPVIGRVFGGNYYTGTISEIIVYTNDISLENVVRVEGYLANKWNVQLDAAHPYYKINPAHMVGGTGIVIPNNIPGLLVWNSGNTLSVGNGNTINTWTNDGNASGPTIDCQGTQLDSALNGSPVADLTTGQDWSSSTALRPSSYTFIQVSRQTASTYGRVFQSSVATTNQLHGYWNGLKQPFYANGWLTYPGAGISSQMEEWAIITETRISSGAFECRWNGGVVVAGASSSANDLEGLAINGAGAQSGEVSTCQIAEVILYNSVLTKGQIIGIEEYLRQKWGLGMN